MVVYILGALSLLLNWFLVWYVVRLLRKFYFISENLADLFLTTKAFRVFVQSLYGMDSYRGEPIIQELLLRIREVSDEIDTFRDIFQYSLDEELEEELNAAEEEAQKVN
jgi:hypothetical protein